MAIGALPEMASIQNPGVFPVAGGAAVALRPAGLGQIFEAGCFVRETLLELHDGAGEVWPGHKTTVGTSPDGTGYS